MEEILESIEKLCKPTASQEEKFRNCPLARESEVFPDSNSDEVSSTPLESTGIVVLSLPDSPCPDEGAVEQHCHSQNSHDLCAQQLTVAEARVETRVRVSEVGLDDEPEAKGLEVEQFDGDTEDAGIEGGEIIVFGGGDSGGEEIRSTSKLDAAGGISDTGKTPENAKKRKHSRSNGGHKSVETSKNAKKFKKMSLSFEGKEKGGEELVVVESSALLEGKEKEVVVVVESSASLEGIEKEKEVVVVESSASLEGKEKEKEVVESSEQKIGFFELMDIARTLLGYNDVDDDSEDLDCIETAEKMGMVFPIPRWWPSQGDEAQTF